MNLLTLLVSVVLAQEVPHIVYFGGYGSTSANMKCWADGIPESEGQISVLPYPVGASSGRNRDIEKTRAYQDLQKFIRENPNQSFKVGGHSSGSQYANQLVEWMLRVGVSPKNIELSNLDGFRASESLRSKVKWKCWSATNGRIYSNNYSSDCQLYKAPHCQTKWCLHFSLVNKTAPKDLAGGSDFIRRGYDKKNCQSNLVWIQR